ncbi:MAG TPA: hypothetical protein VM618_07415 [Acidimicrobiia bacterium]|nr:hypothetical protein [Acidimicrobiia bacterium]
MPAYVNPAISDRAVGVEMRILELSDLIRRVRRWPASKARLAGLEAERRRLYDELARLADRAAAGETAPPVVHATRVH